jgi:hypothetical protein
LEPPTAAPNVQYYPAPVPKRSVAALDVVQYYQAPIPKRSVAAPDIQYYQAPVPKISVAAPGLPYYPAPISKRSVAAPDVRYCINCPFLPRLPPTSDSIQRPLLPRLPLTSNTMGQAVASAQRWTKPIANLFPATTRCIAFPIESFGPFPTSLPCCPTILRLDHTNLPFAIQLLLLPLL